MSHLHHFFKMDNIKNSFVLPEGTSELIIREGQAPDVVQPDPYKFSGLLDAPGIYFTKRQAAQGGKYFDPQHSVVEVDYDAQKITLRAMPSLPSGDVITGTLFAESRLKPFRLNEGAVWKPYDLAVFIRKNKMYFADPEQALQMVHELSTLKLSVKGEIEIADDNRGNTKRLFSQQTNTTIPVSFTLRMPILSGDETVRFNVDVYLEVESGNVRISLESVDLLEMTQFAIKEAMQKQIAIFEASGIPILYK